MTTNQRGFGLIPVLITLAVVLVIGGGAYVVTRPHTAEAPAQAEGDTHVQTAPGDHPEEDHAANEGVQADAKTSISWKLEDAGTTEGGTMPHTKVTAIVNGTPYVVGTYTGSCNEIKDSDNLLAGELSAVRCWFAGGGDEIGVFAHEDGGYDIMVGELGEPTPEWPAFRGNFKVKTTILP
jgi:hypothetical protein